MTETWQGCGSYDRATEIRDLITPHLKPGHVAGLLEVREGVWGFSISVLDTVTADCGCTLIIDVDLAPCAVCGGCTEHCYCVCGAGHPYRAMQDCLVCLEGESQS